MSGVEFDGRAVVVTGAGGGLGRDYVLSLARHGARVVVNDLGGSLAGEGAGSSMADSVVAEVVAAGGEAVACYDSVATPEGGQAIVDACMDSFGRIDAVIHNAGILRDRSLAKLTPEELDAVLDVHLRGGFNIVQPAFRMMRDNGYGRIVLTSSSSGLLGNFGQANYGAAKAGLVGLMHVAAIEGASRGILVNCLAPAARTRMTEGLLGEFEELLDPAKVSAMAVYLASPQCRHSHEIYSAGGGRYARYVVALNDGWFAGAEIADADDVCANLDQIRDLETLHVFGSGAEEHSLLRRMAVSAGLIS